MAESDWYLDAVDEAVAAGQALREALDQTDELFMAARRRRLEGVSLARIVTTMAEDGGRSARLSVNEAFAAWTAAITAYRARAIRAVVDEEGMTLSEIARLSGVSRQMVGRLYRFGTSVGPAGR